MDINDKQRVLFYKSHRERSAITFKKKHQKQYDEEFTKLTTSTPSMSVLEIGCGTGLFLRYLNTKGYTEIVGIDIDENLSSSLENIKNTEIYLDDVLSILESKLNNRKFDRIVMLDVAEHMQLDVLVKLLKLLNKNHINKKGRLLLRVPNIESPWGLKMFFGTFDHIIPFSKGRMFELGKMAGWSCLRVCPQPVGNKIRNFKEIFLNSVLGFLLSYHPDIWSANLLVVYEKD